MVIHTRKFGYTYHKKRNSIYSIPNNDDDIVLLLHHFVMLREEYNEINSNNWKLLHKYSFDNLQNMVHI